jgi:hypothetical protein
MSPIKGRNCFCLARRQAPFAIENRRSNHLIGEKLLLTRASATAMTIGAYFLKSLIPVHRFYSAVAMSVVSEKF